MNKDLAGHKCLTGMALMASVLLATPALAADAKASVEKAEQMAKEAQAKNALWKPANDSIKAAKKAMEEGKADVAAKDADEAIGFVELGLGQLDYPSTDHFQ